MKKIGFVTSPLTSGHAIRGIGFYTKRLLPHLKSQASQFGFEIVDPSTSTYDMIHYPFFDLFTHSLPILKPKKTVVTIHDVIPLEYPEHYPPGLKGNLNLFLQKVALKSVDRVIADSYASVKSIRKYLGVPHQKLKLVYLAADPLFKKISKPKNSFNLPKKFVLYVGDINYNKNISNLVSVCQKIDFPLVIVGKQASQIPSLDLSHPELSHLSSVDFKSVIKLGFVSDEELVNIYNLATVYCQASLSEGFGLPVLEALACRTPVACSNTSSLPELAGNQAEYFDPNSIDQMAASIQAAIGKKITPPNQFSWEKCAQETLQVYAEVI